MDLLSLYLADTLAGHRRRALVMDAEQRTVRTQRRRPWARPLRR